MKMMTRIFLLLLALAASYPVFAVQGIQVQALFSGKAVLLIDGNRRTIAVDETSPEGVKLISADSKQAILEIDGEQASYTLGSSVSLDFVQPESLEERVFSNENGMFLALGTINGQTVRFLVDTGATSVAMNKSQAKKLGIRYRIHGEPATASTASGFVRSYRVRLKSVSLGKIRRSNVEAMVIDGNHPGPILLGMSFLGDLKVEKSGSAMTLRQKN